MKIKKDNKNNPCHSALDAGVDSCQERACEVRGLRDERPLGEQSRSKYSFITTWITQSSWVMTVFVFAFVLSLSACGEEKEEAKSDKPTIKIGAILPLTGFDPQGGENAKKTLIYVASQISKNSIINYEVIVEDNAGQTAKGLSATKKLATYDKVDIIINSVSSVCKATAPYLAAINIPQISFVTDRSAAIGKTNFVFWVSAEEFSRKMIQWLKAKEYKYIVAFVSVNDTSEIRYSALENLLRGSDITLNKIAVTPGAKYFAIDIHKAKELNPNVYLILSPMPELDVLGKQLKESGNNIPLSSMDFLNYTQTPTLFEGAEFISADDGNKEIINELVKTLDLKTTYSVAYIYDALHMIDYIVSNYYKIHNKIPNGDEISTELIKLKQYKGAVGELVINENGVIDVQAVVKTIKNGKPVVIEE